MPDPDVPVGLAHVRPGDTSRSSPAPAIDLVRDAARRVLAADGRDFVLQPWQVAYLVAISEGRAAVAPPGCGVGKAWLQARLDEAARTPPA